jgi:hypothetical protein
MPPCVGMNVERHFINGSTGRIPCGVAADFKVHGSFDCVGTRFASANFAQDDKAELKREVVQLRFIAAKVKALP